MVDGYASIPGADGRVASQLRKGVLEYCVLALLRDGPRYGVELLAELARVDVMVTSQGTIYPLLSRLRRTGLADTHLQESENGPPRRYYTLTDAGRSALEEFAVNWPSFRTAVDHFLAPGETT
ncbi:PadR family transcriptional regulator [Streptomyces sp. RKAG293]|uniref:PadR family transcriptional regulator n=1 Tax=Streptomyces sp. RKAG293 TaxID=2893403 RepID=UPI0020344E38|nr:PadR family transcriptional regulator [Streptomyces sp. RKAG293]MCM2423766.1 PadR family transcriptional regulator [Streptomyces sp. RKAG293]